MSEQSSTSRRINGERVSVVTLLSAFAIAYVGYKNPHSLPVPDEVVDAAKQIVVAVVDEFNRPKDYQTCVMTALAHSPTGGCNFEKK